MACFFGSRLPERIKQTVMAGLGLFTLAIGISMFMDTANPIIVLLAILFGGILGEWWGIEDGLARFGEFLEVRFTPAKESGREEPLCTWDADGLVGVLRRPDDHSRLNPGRPDRRLYLLAIKSVLDMFAALAFASTLGVGVLFSVIVLLVYQGGLSLLAVQAQSLVTDAMMAEMTAAGGVILVGLAISSLLEIKKIRAGNFLPALVIAPLITPPMVALLAWLGLEDNYIIWRWKMIEITIPGFETFQIKYLVTDVNGTIATNGVLTDGVAERFAELQKQLGIYMLTADTHGKQAEIDARLGLKARIITYGTPEKAAVVRELGKAHVIAFGNGANDVQMCEEAALSVGVLGGEGIATALLRW